MAALAKVEASETLSHASGRMIQLHGGIGFTWEHDAHLYFKRAGVRPPCLEAIHLSMRLLPRALVWESRHEARIHTRAGGVSRGGRGLAR